MISTIEQARALDREDPLASYREGFRFPRTAQGGEAVYLCGHSLGLQPVAAREAVERELDAWADRAVSGHLDGEAPWYRYHEASRESAARVVGGLPQEVVLMNGLTVNLHLLLVSFYRPTAARHRILIEKPVFSSDGYVVRTQLEMHGYDPRSGLLEVGPRPGDQLLIEDDIEEVLEREGDSIAVMLLSAVNFLTGQLLDVARLARVARSKGVVVGIDLAHAAGNVPVALHDWDVDFAAWCSYKYLNGGPGAVAGAFVHERHLGDPDLVRFGGWWGNDPETRFQLHLRPDFVPVASADAWQLSNPPILALAPVRASLELFSQVGMPALRTKSLALTGYLERLLIARLRERVTIVTPSEPAARGAQLSLTIKGEGRETLGRLEAAGVVTDFREPNVIRVAPAPLYNSFVDVWRFVDALAGATDRAGS